VNFDALIVGTGQAGPALAARLAAAGMKVAIVERDKFGGTCVNNGCTPTKAMVASAYAARTARRAADYGVVLEGSPRVDMRRVKARKDQIVRKGSEGVEKWMRGLKGASVLTGHARFVDEARVQVGAEFITADRIFVNVGGRPSVPGMPGIDAVPYLTNESMMELDFIPPHLLVIGGSYIGLEFAQVMRRFGSEVTVVEMAPRLVAREDEDVSLAIQDFLQAEGIKLALNAKCLSLRKEGEGVAVGLECGEADPVARGSHVLLAVGRVPTPTISAWTAPASRPMSAATSRSTKACAPPTRASGRWAIATARAPSRTRPTTTTRSSRTTCCPMPDASTRTACRSTPSSPIRRWAEWA
jgi:pyruvate/2-oxoglutarate dehydrogenase complex dihydrolipoamide dehydrogenase (E3) component